MKLHATRYVKDKNIWEWMKEILPHHAAGFDYLIDWEGTSNGYFQKVYENYPFHNGVKFGYRVAKNYDGTLDMIYTGWAWVLNSTIKFRINEKGLMTVDAQGNRNSFYENITGQLAEGLLCDKNGKLKDDVYYVVETHGPEFSSLFPFRPIKEIIPPNWEFDYKINRYGKSFHNSDFQKFEFHDFSGDKWHP